MLFILTLSAVAFGSFLESAGRIVATIFTVAIITPFIVSALDLLGKSKTDLKGLNRAKYVTTWGLIMFGFYLVFTLYTVIQIEFIPQFYPEEEVSLQCSKSPETFNVKANPWKCSSFERGSLAWKCARNPERFNASKSDCADFIPPSS